MRLSSIKSGSSPHVSSANHPLTLRFFGPPVIDPSCSSAELDPPPPRLCHLPSNLLPVSSCPLAFTPLPVGSQGEDISNPKPNMSIRAHDILSIHDFLWGPSTKEIIIYQ
ncbi:hypothetical protein ILYODFUR_021190 [Ilyodon furcidens]|uniref:Uncharacterized protein n=1 Tax=Ilyodon furcidens TaxID=33524 RepID=A0ABV0UJB4_9TELE